MFPAKFELLNSQQRHDYILKRYVLNKYGNDKTHRHKRDIDIIKENHKFLWDEEDVPDSWETRLAKKYYDKLFKEYCIADLSRYKENKIAMRWRTEQEVVTGKGQFQCGSRKCDEKDLLRTWEVNFGYLEQNVKKNALVKLRLCPEHSAQLNYTSKKREVKRLKYTESRKCKKRKRDIEDNADHENNREKSSTPSEKTCESGVDPQTSEDIFVEEEDIWMKKPEVDEEQNTRENDFEKYLEDLLL